MSLSLVGLNGYKPEALSYGTIQRLRDPGVRVIARATADSGIRWLADTAQVAIHRSFDHIPIPTPAESISDIIDAILADAASNDVIYLTPGHPVLGENLSVQLFTKAHADGLLAGVSSPQANDPSDGVSDYASLVAVMSRLRDPDTGCPWDLEQTPETLRRYLVEEAYEVIEAIDAGDPAKQAEELGDLLLQVVFQAQLAREANQFDNGDIIRHIVLKLIRRHPHIFGSTVVAGTDEVLRNWEQIKRTEKGYEDRTSILDGIPKDLPALMRALEVSKRVVKVGFEWPSVNEVLDKVEEEIAELRVEIRDGDREKAAAELGDLLFTLVNVARQLKVDPEESLRAMTHRFAQRFRRIEQHAHAQGRQLSDLSLDEMEAIWQAAKREE